MSQKTNPISLRLQKSNKHFESCWYSDFFYNQVLDDDLELRLYIDGMFYQAARSKTLPSIQSQYKRYYTLLFFLDQRGERHKREYSLKLSREPTEHVLKPRIKYLQGKNNSFLTGRRNYSLKQSQDLYSRGMLSEEEKNNFLVKEGFFKERKTRIYSRIQEYVSTYAIKGLSLETLLLSGVGVASCQDREHASCYSSVINPGLERNLFARTRPAVVNKRPGLPVVFNSGSRDLYKKTKGFLTLLTLSFAFPVSLLVRLYLHPRLVMPRPSNDINTIFPARGESIRGHDQKYSTTWSIRDLRQKIPYFLPKVNRESTTNPLLVQKYSEKELIYFLRGLSLDHRSKSTQNRLSRLFLGALKKQVIYSSVLACSDDFSINRMNAITFASLLEEGNSKSKANYSSRQEWRDQGKGLFHHTELLVNLYPGNFGYHSIHPVRGISAFQSANFLIESVAYLLQRKRSFRQIKDDLFRELEQHPLVKGARLSCAGRLGGRSKKAQKAKTQTAQWGETSLNVFSSRLSFASKGVHTTYGKVGVKLWLCYKS